MPERVEDGRGLAAGAFPLLKLELVGPGDDRAPHQLVGGNDDEDHGYRSPQHAMVVTGACRRLQIRAETRKPEVAIAQNKHLAGHQEKPSARDRDHGVPHQPNGGVRQFELPKALPCGKAKDIGGFAKLTRQALERCVEAEGHVPYLPGKNQHDGAQLDAQLAPGNQRHHGQHYTGQEAQDGNRLQNIEHRDHEGFCTRVVSGDVTVGHGKDQAQEVGDDDAHHGVKSVERQHLRRGRNGDGGNRVSHPILRDAQDSVKEGEPAGSDAQVEKKRPRALKYQGAGEGGRAV